jgi:hypothetical protein
VRFVAVNTEYDRIYNSATKKLEELRATKKTLSEIRKKQKSRAKVEVVMEEDAQAVDEGEMAAEEN